MRGSHHRACDFAGLLHHFNLKWGLDHPLSAKNWTNVAKLNAAVALIQKVAHDGRHVHLLNPDLIRLLR